MRLLWPWEKEKLTPSLVIKLLAPFSCELARGFLPRIPASAHSVGRGACDIIDVGECCKVHLCCWHCFCFSPCNDDVRSRNALSVLFPVVICPCHRYKLHTSKLAEWVLLARGIVAFSKSAVWRESYILLRVSRPASSLARAGQITNENQALCT